MDEPVWIPKEIVLALHQRQVNEHGGDAGIRDESLLESAIARPQQRYTYDSSADIYALAASYAKGLAKNHPFIDGNKRTAFVVYRLFLLRNGITATAPQGDRYSTALDLAAGDMEEEAFATWLRRNTASIS
ncbi:type II toxin-antitoxin system death-on-curing family toxin [Luteolibacter luteus]|uniref:Type II toxin-antitoxin system death-on-curing family toxin n=1 Tax=Luteolibacter luteus TaxID=2728835 RepID=A0A858RM44_9BACT|nr:type II toxin-antitoxin system death-on-curing family toxin [Luteolibacter luteus]QJE97795.1 type II toxin-antitoxin system death-on-curing family toxin [Luteolibacter luteus]